MANDLRIKGNIVLTCATTAIAACLLPKGRTVHYKLKVPLSLHPNSLLGFSKESPTSEVLKQAQLLVIDEVTMADRWMLEASDKTLRDVRDQEDTLFGGLPVLLSGDWRQCLPVVTKGSRADIVYKTVKASSTIWQNPNIYHLTENMRVKNAGEDDQAYANYLIEVGEGKIPTCSDIGEDMILIEKEMKSKKTNLPEFCREIFEDLKKDVRDGMKNRATEPNWSENLMKKAIICPRNSHVDKINEIVMQEIEGEEFVLKSADRCLNETDALKFPEEWLNHITPTGTPPHRLVLKKGAPIMMLRNLK